MTNFGNNYFVTEKCNIVDTSLYYSCIFCFSTCWSFLSSDFMLLVCESSTNTIRLFGVYKKVSIFFFPMLGVCTHTHKHKCNSGYNDWSRIINLGKKLYCIYIIVLTTYNKHTYYEYCYYLQISTAWHFVVGCFTFWQSSWLQGAIFHVSLLYIRL